MRITHYMAYVVCDSTFITQNHGSISSNYIHGNSYWQSTSKVQFFWGDGSDMHVGSYLLKQ